MPLLQTVKKRRSVRTFDGTPLKNEDLETLLAFAETADSPYGIPVSWKTLDAKKENLSCPVIVGTELYLAGKIRRAQHAEEAFGWTMKRVVLFAEEMGLGTTWIAGTFDRAAFEKAAGLAENEAMPCVTPLGYPAEKMSLREGLMRKGVKADTRLPFETLFFRDGFAAPLTPEGAGPLKTAFECVRLAPSAVNKQPWRAVVCGEIIHFYEKRRAPGNAPKWDIQKVDLGIAMCHFSLALKEAGIGQCFSVADPGIPTPPDTSYIATFTVEA